MAKTAAKPRQKKPKQPFLEGMEPPSIPEIDEAAEELADVHSQRMALTKRETDLADVLLALMHQHKLKVYEFDSKRVEVDSLEKVKVRKAKAEGNREASDGD